MVGHTEEEYVNQNTQRDLDDEGAAENNAARIRKEIEQNGGPRIPYSGKHGDEYDAIANDPDLSEEDKRRFIGESFADREHVSGEKDKTYRQYYSEPYKNKWKEAEAQHQGA